MEVALCMRPASPLCHLLHPSNNPTGMASPALQNGTAHPSTPPPSDTATNSQAKREPASKPEADLDLPRLSTAEDGSAKRPRDARLIHLVLAKHGVESYQERVPLQLLDFAYRYTSSILSDSLRLSSEGYAGAPERTGRGRGGGDGGAGGGGEGITVTSLRQAIATRTGTAFQGGYLPKEFMLQQAEERNKVALPKVQGRGYGLLLPDEKYCLTGVGWNLKEEWESDVADEEEEEEEQQEEGQRKVNGVQEDVGMSGVDGDDEEGEGKMEDVFGEGEGGEDTEMS